MLGYIRESVQGWIAWAIVILLIIPFALWGINEYFGTGGKLVVANVNGTEISKQSLDQAYQIQRNQMRQMLGKQYDPAQFDEGIKRRALNDLVDREILFQHGSDTGFRVSDESVRVTIQNIEDFQEDGRFSNTRYKQLLNAQGESPVGFENRIHRAILTQQLYSGISSTALVTKQQVDAIVKLQEQQRDIAYITIPQHFFSDESAVSDEAIQQHYEQNKASFVTPEQVSLEYLELKAADLDAQVEVSDEKLMEFFKQRESMYQTPEFRKSSHILVTVDEGADEATINKAREKAQALHKRVKDGEDFAKVAKEASEDPGSAQNGGVLDFYTKDQAPDPSYGEALFALKEAEISEPVLSAFGFHIIKLDKIRASKSKSFDEVKEALSAEYKKDVAVKAYFDRAEKLARFAYEQPDSLEVAASEAGLDIKVTPFFARHGGPGIAGNPKVSAAAFSKEVLKDGYNSEPIEMGENHVVVVRVKEHKESQEKPLEAVKAQIKRQLVAQAAKDKVRETGEKLLQRLKDGEAVEAVVAEVQKLDPGLKEKNTKSKDKPQGASWIQAGALKRADTKVNRQIISAVFKLSKSEEGKPVYGGLALANGDYSLFALNNIIDVDPAKLDEAKRTTVKRNLSSAQGESAFASMLADLKEGASISILEDNL